MINHTFQFHINQSVIVTAPILHHGVEGEVCDWHGKITRRWLAEVEPAKMVGGQLVDPPSFGGLLEERYDVVLFDDRLTKGCTSGEFSGSQIRELIQAVESNKPNSVWNRISYHES